MIKIIKTQIRSIIALSIFVFVFANFYVVAKAFDGSEKYYQSVRSALTEINFPKSDDFEAIKSASENLAEFIFYRSGVRLNREQINILIENEKTARSELKYISKSRLAEILTEIAVGKLAILTDEQRDRASKSLQGFTAADLPESFTKGEPYLKLRADGRGGMAVEKFNNYVGTVRGKNAGNKFTKKLIYKGILEEIESKTDILIRADESFFSGRSNEFTPLQAVLIGYAVVTDDNFSGNKAELTKQMENLQEGIIKLKGHYPSPKGWRAYGENGYFFSTPTDILMDETTINYFLNKLKEKSALK